MFKIQLEIGTEVDVENFFYLENHDCTVAVN